MQFRRAVAALASLLVLTSCDFLRGYAEGHSTALRPYEEQDLPAVQMGAARFVFDDFGALSTDTLETDAVPWKLIAAALVEQRYPDEPATDTHLREVMKRFGFLYPATLGNWPFQAAPVFRTPLGVVSGVVQRDLPRIEVEVANLACASCHAGITYDASGNPLSGAWLGMPNTSLDLDAYSAAVRAALRAMSKSRTRVLDAVKQLFHDVSPRELRSLEAFIGSDRVAQLAAGTAASPYQHGGPGRSNVLGALKVRLHLTPNGPGIAAVSTPQIGDQPLRWSLLADGAFARLGDPRFGVRASGEGAPRRSADLVAFFTLPQMGVHPDKSANAVESMSEVLNFFSHYKPPRYPGGIDEAAATRGAVIYARCAECHGEYVERDGHLALRSFPNRLSPFGEIGTDPARSAVIDVPLVDAIEGALLGTLVDVKATRGYVAPNLAGLWATAPYLHNGSVPTLAALMTPAERPAKFWVGGHKLDFIRMGIAGAVNERGEYAYPADYLPWSTPRLFDTSQPGHSNRGHEHEFDGLTAADKADLIEFLKQL